MRNVFLSLLMLFLLFVNFREICASQTDSDQAMTPQEKADFLNTMFPLAKQNGIVMDVVRIDTGDPNIVRNDFLASFKDGQKALEQVINHPETATAIELLVATDMAFHSGQLQEAAFLFHAGRIRLHYDLEKYPPRESDASKTMWFLNVLENDVRIDLVRSLYAQPKILAAVVEQLEAWNIKEQPGYNPGWEHTPTDAPAERFDAIKAENLEYLKPLALLLNIPEYFQACRTLRECNELPLDQQEDKAVVKRRLEAEAVMREIEKEQNLKGVIYQTVDQPSE